MCTCVRVCVKVVVMLTMPLGTIIHAGFSIEISICKSLVTWKVLSSCTHASATHTRHTRKHSLAHTNARAYEHEAWRGTIGRALPKANPHTPTHTRRFQLTKFLVFMWKEASLIWPLCVNPTPSSAAGASLFFT